MMAVVALTLGLVSSAPADCRNLPDTVHIQVAGRFSNTRYTEEHAYGYTVELWQAGGCLFGLFESSDGLAGDTPVGLLSDVRYRAGGNLEFTAKLTTGMTTVGKAGDLVPSRDLFVFSGRLGARALEGRLRRSDALRPESEPVAAAIVLPRVEVPNGPLADARTYGAWRAAVESMLRFRGPRW